jgi:hypothetical protein
MMASIHVRCYVLYAYLFLAVSWHMFDCSNFVDSRINCATHVIAVFIFHP